MAPPRRDTEDARAEGWLPEGAPGSVVRRAPFSDNPEVGARGQRTQQRILDAALEVFDEEGYHQCTIDRIAKRAGCSRVAFYQYFGSKEELFSHLAGQVARQLSASIEALDPVTPDAAGWATMRAWVGRHSEIYEHYEPVYQAFDAAAESDESVAGGAARFTDRNVATMRSKLTTTEQPARHLDEVITLLHEAVTRTRYVAGLLRAAAPAAYSTERVDDALTDVWHRTLFGLVPGVNVHPPAAEPPPVLEFDSTIRDALLDDAGDVPAERNASAARTQAAIIEAGREVFVQRGYLPTRIDDIAAAVGVSHGAFYRYFQNKGQLARLLALRAMRTVSTAVLAMPMTAPDGTVDGVALRRWLRHYNTTHSNEAAMFRVWVDATIHDPTLDTDSAPALDWGRRRMAQFLRPRGFGDVETEALVMLALLEALGARARTSAAIDAAGYIVTRGLLGTD